MSQEIFVTFCASCRQVSIVDCSNGVFSSINRLRWTVKIIVPPVKFLEPYDSNQSSASLTLHENDAVHVQLTSGTSSSNREEERPPEPITGFGSRAGTTNGDASCLGGFVRRYLSTRNLRITSNFFRCTMYLASHSVLCHCLVKQYSRNDKRKKKKGLSDVSVPQSWPRWAHSVSHSRVTVEHGIKFGIDQNRDAAANCWRLAPWLMPAARRRHPRFSAIFDRLFDRLPVRISTSDLHHWILRKKIFHIRAYDFGVQFSFNTDILVCVVDNLIVNLSQRSPRTCSSVWRAFAW